MPTVFSIHRIPAWTPPTPLRPFPSPSSKPTCPFSSSPKATLLPPKSRIPNLLTYTRLLSIPLLTFSELHPMLSVTRLSPLLFSLSSLTDFLDGYLARKWNCQTSLGAFLDPVADKLLVSTALTFTLFRLPTPALAIPTAAIVAREIYVSALREWAALQKLNPVVKVSPIGKVKTAAQMVSLIFLLFARFPNSPLIAPGTMLLSFAAALGVFSAVQYTLAAMHALRQQRK